MKVLVQPRSGKSGIAGLHDGMLKVKLASPPVDGQANDELVKFLAKLFRLPKTAVSIEKGERSKRKTVKVLTEDVDSVTKIIKLYM